MTDNNPSQDSTCRQHNYCFDFLKGIACVCVVFMHCEFPGRLGVIVQAVSRFCVPFFFMLSGYYSYYDGEKQYNAVRKISHIARITAFASLFYLLVAVVGHLVFGGRISLSFRSVLVNWLVFNQPVVISGHLWFLFALLYDYILFSLVDKMRLTRLATYMIAVFIVAYISLAQGAHLAGINVPNMFYRNFLIEGVPLFMLGYWLHCNKGRASLFCDSFLLIGLCASTVLCLLERKVIGRDFGVNIFTFPQVVCLFIIGMRNPEWFEESVIARFGARFSMFVYVLHIFVWRILNCAYAVLHISKSAVALYLKPIAVLGATILFSSAIAFCTTKICQTMKSTGELEMRAK